MNLEPHIQRFRTRFDEVEKLVSAPDLYDNPQKAQELLREHRFVKQALDDYGELEDLDRQIKDNNDLIGSGEDEELAAMARDELPELEKKREEAHRRFLGSLVPPNPNDSRNTIVEIRAGTGGDEAALFAADLFRMYSRYAERSGWQTETLEGTPSTLGGYKEIVFMVKGEDVFKKMQFESGVHRVQRVPATESQGRIHTSAASVAVLPEAKEVDLVIRPDEIRVEVCRAGGPGGQGVNTTDSAVQIMHLPTGMIVRCQDGRSQIKNREKAMNILRSRLLEARQKEEHEKYAANRKQQIGSGDRNEKIRTYNYPQNRITDHRINFTAYNLESFMDGDISELLDQLIAEDVDLKLKDLQDTGS